MSDEPRHDDDLAEPSNLFVRQTVAEVKVPGATPADSPSAGRLRLWPAVVAIVLQWLIILVPTILAPGSFPHFAGMVIGPLTALVLLVLWWLFFSRVPWKDRLVGIALMGVVLVVVGYAVHPTMRAGMLLYVLPLASTALVVTLWCTAMSPWSRRRWLAATAFFTACAAWLLVRSHGMDGSMNSDFGWRWGPTSEEKFLARADTEPQSAVTPLGRGEMSVSTQPGDWPEFRGPARDSVLSGVQLATDWKRQPPLELWRRPLGPGWSSFAVVGELAFTQEQRGTTEVVSCYRSDTGEPCWVNAAETRFMESVSGPGPRATPTFSGGRLFTTGANGTVQCLEAGSGQRVWSRELMQDTDAALPVWGFSSSPLIVGNVVIVFAGDPAGKSVVGYDRATGEVVWTAGTGRMSYSSPHLVQTPQGDFVAMVTEIGMEVFEPANGAVVWRYDWKVPGMRIIQPHWVGDEQLVIGEDYSGCRLLRVDKSTSPWTAVEQWATRDLKPYFNDFVTHAGFCYGFDGKLFTCVDLATGKRRWKGGRFGFGQVLLLADMPALLVLAESGEVVLLEANPQELVELGRFQAITGKTWNHPVVAHGRLFVRNSEEAACFALPQSAGTQL